MRLALCNNSATRPPLRLVTFEDDMDDLDFLTEPETEADPDFLVIDPSETLLRRSRLVHLTRRALDKWQSIHLTPDVLAACRYLEMDPEHPLFDANTQKAVLRRKHFQRRYGKLEFALAHETGFSKSSVFAELAVNYPHSTVLFLRLDS